MAIGTAKTCKSFAKIRPPRAAGAFLVMRDAGLHPAVGVAQPDAIDAVPSDDVEVRRSIVGRHAADFFDEWGHNAIAVIETIVVIDFSDNTERNLGHEDRVIDRMIDKLFQLIAQKLLLKSIDIVSVIPVRHPVQKFRVLFHITTSIWSSPDGELCSVGARTNAPTSCLSVPHFRK